MASAEWLKIYGNRKQKEKKYVHTIQMRFDDDTWNELTRLSKALSCSKVEFVRTATRLLIETEIKEKESEK